MTNIIGCRFGRLVALKPTSQRDCNRSVIWECQCDCGKVAYVSGRNLRNGTTKSCGCLQKELTINRNKNSIVDLTNQKFGKLLVIEKTENRHQEHVIWKCRCDCGNICFVSSQYLRSGETASCGCMRSKGEEKIINLLEEYDIKYVPQKFFDNCRFLDTNALARFDFYLVDYNTLVEYDGEQHFYYQNGSGWNNKENFEKTKSHDCFKNKWCKENGIKLVRIPYTQYESLTIEDLLGDNFAI